MAVNSINGVFADNISAWFTDRLGGVSKGPYHGFNVGDHVADVPSRVAYNRRLLLWQSGLVTEPAWLEQVHSNTVLRLPGTASACADGAVSNAMGQALVVMTADCLPVLLASQDGQHIGVAHAGWRGLAAGVIENAVTSMAVAPVKLTAWLGPCIGPRAFEVGTEVRDAFVTRQPEAASAFVQHGARYLADLQQLARQRLQHLGVRDIHQDSSCTYQQRQRFFSYRRDGQCGRMAFVIVRKK
ncbi:peptidoglycan editing factor PgeF [Gallaecimonas sp. GXIMD1310]|uniref:peptidoglycan editing factor PgeF n=1 Tax=Gallaecimonas sp. GXIMD1310 TaxID=3131926 RepID=UPI00324301EC